MFYGIQHAFSNRGSFAGFTSLVFPPAAIYFAAEGLFWYDESAGWEATVKEDQIKMGYIFTAVTSDLSPADKIQLETIITSFSKEVKEYPEEYKLELQIFARELLAYYNSFYDDWNNLLDINHLNGKSLKFVKSDETKNLEKDFFNKYPHLSELSKQIEMAIELVNSVFSKKVIEINTNEKRDEFEIFKRQIDFKLELQRSALKETYDKIF